MTDLDLDRAARDPWYVLKITRGHDPDCAVHPAAWGRLVDESCVGCLPWSVSAADPDRHDPDPAP